MISDNLSVREMQSTDIELIANYWFHSTDDHLVGMGVDLAKLPSRDQLSSMLQTQLEKPYLEKQSYCIIWELDNRPIGHCNINHIKFGEEAFMHLHMWDSSFRKKGVGTQLVKASIPYFFKNYALKNLFCEPYALNPAPNKTLEKIGFKFVKKYTTIPGSLNFEQEVNRWSLSFDDFQLLK